MAEIKKKRSYKVYRESLIAKGRIPGNFEALQFLGKKGERKNKHRRKQLKEAKTKMHEDQSEEGRLLDMDLEGENAHGVEEDGLVDGGEQQVDEIEETRAEDVQDGVGVTIELNCGAENVDQPQQAAEIDAFYDALMEKGMESARNVEEMLIKKRNDVEEVNRSDNASTSRKKGKKTKNKSINRNLGSDFVDGTIARNIAQYRSLQKDKRV